MLYKIHIFVKGSANTLKQGIASAILEDVNIREVIADAGMLAIIQYLEREEFVDNILKKIK